MNPSNSNFTKQIKKLPSESDDLSKYNIFKIIASVCNACVNKICELLPTPSVLTLAKPCNYDESINNVDQINNDSIKLRLIYDKYDNEIHEDLDRFKYISDSCKPCYACNCLINQPKSITYAPWQQKAGNPAYGDGGQIGLRRLSRFEVPIERYLQNFQSASIENCPLFTQGKHVDVYDALYDKACHLCGQCEFKYKPKLEWNSRDLEPQSCKCSLCECLSCPLQKEASFAKESLESSKTNVIHNYIEHGWKGSLRNNKHQIQACRTPNMCCKHFRDSTKINLGKLSKEKCPVTCSKRGNNRKRWQCSQKDICSTFNFNKVYTIYDSDFKIEENYKNVSTENSNKILTDQLLKNMYGENTMVDHDTNTENLTAHKCIETDSLANKKSFVDNKVTSYEYTLKIEIKAPNFDINMKEDMKQRIKKASKNKILEQTQKVMKDVIIDISNNSLLDEMFCTENPSALQPSESENPVSIGDIKSQDQNKIRSISNKIWPVSLKSTKLENQNSSDMVTTLPRTNCSKMEDYIVGCVKEIAAKKSELPRTDESLLSQSYWSPVAPESVKMRTQVDVMEKLVGCVGSTADMNKSGKCLDDLRVREPCLRRVSNHTVSLKWKLPVLTKEIEGYEILVDGRIIEKILNPKRCLAVVSCLPPVRRLMITIRTLLKTPSLRGLYPCTTIGYQPRSNKRADFWTT